MGKKPRGKHAREKEVAHPFWRGFREIVIIVVVALALSALLRAFLIQAFYVPSASMEDTLRPGGPDHRVQDHDGNFGSHSG